MILIKNCEVYAPHKLGKKDILLASGEILEIGENIETGSLKVKVINGENFKAIPGLIDGHVHIAGAGGEGGPKTRTPEVKLSQLIEGGITTVIGCLGTDGMTRSIESVLMKAKAFREEGISAWIYTGSYQIPTPTILGDVGKDIALIEEVIGVGEVAISDHRSSYPSVNELIRLAEHARVGGMLGGKAGIINLHMGDAKNPFALIYEVVEKSELNFKQFIPTHCNRNDYIFEDAKTYGKSGYVDITASSYPYFPQYEIKPAKAIVQLIETGVPLENITMTSDGGGSLPDFDEQGNLIKLVSGDPASIFRETMEAVKDENLPLEKALLPVTLNPATALKLASKGRLEDGKDADIVLIDQNYDIHYVIANGEIMMENGEIIKKGIFEKE
ncbi:MAG: beta-aspartyl-peptidase [Candidatus Cloacimonetes bacterium]|nr:beta-aspartyl-peptidase [Candidatus Cloacimonadota bacterium]